MLRSREPLTADGRVSPQSILRHADLRLTVSVDLGPSDDANESTADETDEGHAEDTEPDRQAAAELAGANVRHSSIA